MATDIGTPIPPSITHPLVCYLGSDGNVWAINASDGRGYCVGIANDSPGLDVAPDDGQTYVQQGSTWVPVAIPTVGGVINSITPAFADENTTVTLDIVGTGFDSSSVINWAGYPIPTTFVSATELTGQLTLGPGSAGRYTIVVTTASGQQSNSVAFVVNPAGTTFLNGGATCVLVLNPQGDLILTQKAGPNAGRSVNLTYGKWQ